MFTLKIQEGKITKMVVIVMANDKNYDKWYIQIGLKISYYRKLNKLTQEQLAEHVGIASKYLSQIETPSAIQPVSLNTLFKIADELKVPPHKFFEFEDRN